MATFEVKHRTRFNLKGRRFGKLKVIERTYKKKGDAFWLCKCDCGNETIVSSSALRHGKIVSCKCVLRSCRKKKPFMWCFNLLKYHAKKRNRSVKISYADFLTFTRQPACHYCNNPIEWLAHFKRSGNCRYNIDRKDSKKGYVKGNCVVCCWQCNSSKNNKFSYDDWYAMTKVLRDRVVENQKVVY